MKVIEIPVELTILSNTFCSMDFYLNFYIDCPPFLRFYDLNRNSKDERFLFVFVFVLGVESKR